LALTLDRRTFLAAGAALAAAGTAGPALATYGDLPIAGTVELAVVGPFTGDQIRLGEQMGNGVRAAVDDANQLRGTLDKAYTMRTFDDQNLLATGLQAADFACDDSQAIAVIGHLSGRITEQVLHDYLINKMVVICPSSTYDRLTMHGYGNILRLLTKDSTEGQFAARYAYKTVKPTAVTVLSQDGDYGGDVASGFQEEMQGDKLKVNAITFSWNKPDFDAVTAKALDPKPDLVFLAGITKNMGDILPKLRAAGYAGPIYASQGFFDAATAQYGADAEGIVISSSMPPLALAPGAFRQRSAYEERYGAITPLAAFSYAAAQIVISIVRRVNASDRVAVLQQVDFGSTYDTIVGELSFSNTGDPLNPNVYFYSLKNGVWKYESSALPASFIVK
jgi:branched-chain amino acid transport system substrate-binding protein